MGVLGRNLGNLVIVKYLGAAALAQFVIGTYGEPIILAFRNSISSVVLPELVRLGGSSNSAALRLWQRATVITCMLLLPCAALVAWYAQPLVLTAFGAPYRAAVPVLQWYTLVIFRACFDFSPLLRAINQTRSFVVIGLVAGAVNAVALALLLPLTGIVGAAIALAVSSVVEAICLGYSVNCWYRCGWRGLLPWSALAKVMACVAGAAAVAFGVTYAWRTSLMGVIAGSILYGAVFVAMLLAVRLEEAAAVAQRLRPLAPALFRR
jgi:O-antigen/teichoic acid export membrane protein